MHMNSQRAQYTDVVYGGVTLHVLNAIVCRLYGRPLYYRELVTAVSAPVDSHFPYATVSYGCRSDSFE